MQDLDKLPRIKSSNNINGPRKVYDQIEVCVRNLKALSLDINSSGALLVLSLNRKLPSEIKVILSQNFQNNIWHLDGMLKTLKREVGAKERSFSTGTSYESDLEKCERNYVTLAFLNNTRF